ncbi:hypothetical protein [Pseudomonas sp. 24 E 13]|nr:hypothetical protein [Pseudomonas sp. 24 E 13]
MTGQVDTADRLPLVKDRLADGLLEQGMRQFEFNPRQHPIVWPHPLRQQLATGIKDFGLGHLFGRSDQAQGFSGGGAVVEHHSRFHGVIDRACDQVQVVFGVHPQRQHAEQGQGHTGQRHRHQGQDHVPSADD